MLQEVGYKSKQPWKHPANNVTQLKSSLGMLAELPPVL